MIGSVMTPPIMLLCEMNDIMLNWRKFKQTKCNMETLMQRKSLTRRRKNMPNILICVQKYRYVYWIKVECI